MPTWKFTNYKQQREQNIVFCEKYLFTVFQFGNIETPYNYFYPYVNRFLFLGLLYPKTNEVLSNFMNITSEMPATPEKFNDYGPLKWRI